MAVGNGVAPRTVALVRTCGLGCSRSCRRGGRYRIVNQVGVSGEPRAIVAREQAYDATGLEFGVKF